MKTFPDFAAAAPVTSAIATKTHPPVDMGALPLDWRRRVPGQRAELATAWSDPAAGEGTTTAGEVTLEASEAGMFALDETPLEKLVGLTDRDPGWTAPWVRFDNSSSSTKGDDSDVASLA